MIANGFAQGCLFFGLLFGYALVDTFEDLLFGEARVLEAADRGGAKCRQALQVALKDNLDGGVRQANQAKHDGVAADRVELICASKADNIGLRVARSQEARNRLGARKWMMVRAGCGNQRDAGVVGDAGMLEADQLLDFGVRNVERLELLDGGRAHPGLIERAIVRERVLMATAGQEQRNAESQVTVPHTLIVGVASKRTLQCAVGDTRRKDRVTSQCPLRATNFSLRLIDAFNAVYTCDFANTGQDGLELAAIDDFEIDVNLGV